MAISNYSLSLILFSQGRQRDHRSEVCSSGKFIKNWFNFFAMLSLYLFLLETNSIHQITTQ